MIISPALQMYASPIPILTLPEFILILLLVFIILFVKIKFEYNKLDLFLPFLFFLLILVIYYSVFYFVTKEYLYFDSAGTFIHLAFVYIVCYLFASDFFDKKFAIKFIKYSSLFFCIYGAAQIFCAKVFNFYLFNNFPFLPSMDGIGHTTYESMVQSVKDGYTFRPCSLFREPAHYAAYVSLALLLTFLQKKKKIFDWVLIGIFTISIALSLSTTGIASLALIYILYFIKIFVEKKKYRLYIGIGFAIFVAAFALLMFVTPIGDYILEKTFHGDYSLDSILEINRISNVLGMFEYRGFLNLLIGNGSMNSDAYLPGFAMAFNNIGIVGFVLMFAPFLCFIDRKNIDVTFLIVFFLFLNIGTETAFGCFTYVYLCLMLVGDIDKGFNF